MIFMVLFIHLNTEKERLEATVGGGMNHYLGDHFGKIIWMKYAGNTEKDYQWYFNNSRKGEISLYGKVNYSLSDKTSVFGDLQYRYIFYKMKGIDDDLKDIGQEHSSDSSTRKQVFSIQLHLTRMHISHFLLPTGNLQEQILRRHQVIRMQPPDPKHFMIQKWDISSEQGKLHAGVNFYGMIYKDQLVPTGELSDVGYSIMTNVEKSYRMGLEISCRN